MSDLPTRDRNHYFPYHRGEKYPPKMNINFRKLNVSAYHLFCVYSTWILSQLLVFLFVALNVSWLLSFAKSYAFLVVFKLFVVEAVTGCSNCFKVSYIGPILFFFSFPWFGKRVLQEIRWMHNILGWILPQVSSPLQCQCETQFVSRWVSNRRCEVCLHVLSGWRRAWDFCFIYMYVSRA